MHETTQKMFDLKHRTDPPRGPFITPTQSQAQTLWTLSSAHLLDPPATFRSFGVRAAYDEHGALVEVPKRNPEGCPPWLVHIFDRARADGACVISFDRRAAMVDGLSARSRITATHMRTIAR
jgi:hypothetical protein